ncbi:Chloramphenicol acetyltransferase-like domain-containing protein [Artemisia annua]|uniref:Chloramphenicol acetyltransferase-like domain-containing protein n=1 Tax=Artemisia annua TaxID=35608 RepID=A0A2U1LQY6_ARTAN|nr:Chloramphenicol acetyltransferase-like domain-containing protein [Artemisia annua]
MNYDEKQITDINFEGTPLRIGIKEITNDDDVQAFLTCAYESKWVIDLYAEHLDEDFRIDDDEDLGDVEFFHEGDENVEIKNVSTKDPFLNKLCSNSGEFKGFIDEPVNDWDKMEPVLGMRFESNEQLKLALANYGVHNGYQLWFERNDWKQLLVYCGRDVEADGEGTSKDGEGSSKSSAKVPKKGRIKRKAVKSSDKEKDVCGFRLFASWMSTENSFQIKSLKPKHKCSRNYNLGSLVTYKWIAHNFAKELIEDPFIPLLKMQTQIRSKYHIDVSVGQCQRAKQRASFDYEGGLKEHYARLWEYRNAVIDTNPGNTCVLDDEETSSGKYWHVVPSGFQELEVTSGSQAYGVNLTRKKCMCGMWELFGIPCIHAVAAYEHMNRDPVQGVHDCSMWKRTRDTPLLPPLMRTMPGMPKKKRIIAPDENTSQVTRRGRIMTCSNYQERGHNKSSCKKEPVPKPPKPTRASNNTTTPDFTTYASARGGGRGSRGGRGGGRGSRGGGRGQQRTMFMDEDEIRKNMHHEYMEDLLIQEEERLAVLDRERLEQEAFDEEALRLTLEEEERWKEQDLKREQDEHTEHVEWEKNMVLHPSCYMSDEESIDQEPYNRDVVSVNEQIETQESIFVGIRDAPPADDALLIPEVVDAPCDPNDDAANKGKAVAVPEPKKKGTKRQARYDPLRIYHKNRGRSERIFGQKMKKTGFGENGEEIIAISSNSLESDFDARPWGWEDYFPKDFKATDYFEPAKRVEPSSNLTTIEEQKMAFKARVQKMKIIFAAQKATRNYFLNHKQYCLHGASNFGGYSHAWMSIRLSKSLFYGHRYSTSTVVNGTESTFRSIKEGIKHENDDSIEKKVDIEITCKETIKPASQTPNNLRTFNLSIIDQWFHDCYTPLILFFPNNKVSSVTDVIKNLKESLSQILTRFYPIAGEVKNKLHIECNDKGVNFMEARVNQSLREFLRQPDDKRVRELVPNSPRTGESSIGNYVIGVQVNIFNCGGIGLSMSVTHKIFDGHTYFLFMKAWAAAARGSPERISPSFMASQVFPNNPSLNYSWPSKFTSTESIITKRFLFDPVAIASLKAQPVACTDLSTPRSGPTRAEATSSLIWKAVAKASSIVRPLGPQASPPLPYNTIGNLVRTATAICFPERQPDLPTLMSEIRESIAKINSDHIQSMKDGDNCLFGTSILNSGMYELDFGWGKPIWFYDMNAGFSRIVALNDTLKAGSVEATVTLKSDEMEIFEHDHELLSYATVDPSPLNFNDHST